MPLLLVICHPAARIDIYLCTKCDNFGCWISSVNGSVSAGGSFSRHLCVKRMGDFCHDCPPPAWNVRGIRSLPLWIRYWSRDPDHAHYGVVCHPKYIYSTCIQNLATLALAVPDIQLRALKLKIGHPTLTMPLLRVICHPYAGTWHR